VTKYFCSDNIAEVSAADIGEYPLPFDPEMLVRVKSVPMARMKQFFESNQKGGAVASAAEKALIQESIINPDGTPVYASKDHAESLLKGRTRLVSALVKMISLHNGGEDKVAEEAEKKSETTP
jgi:hypothetical protein